VPRYEYICNKCDSSFTAIHGMADKLNKCDVCGTEGTVEIVPSILRSTQIQSKQKAGELVKQYIKDTKQYIEEQKKDLKNDY
tara:strand:- start:208 stop:453 length:246 start_codon:yes stop_codon:yes gene_type:complete